MRGRTKIARRHGRGAQVGDAIQRLVQRSDDATLLQHIIRATGALDGFFAPQHIRPARGDQYQIVKAHDLERTRGRADIARVRGFDQDKARGTHGIDSGK